MKIQAGKATAHTRHRILSIIEDSLPKVITNLSSKNEFTTEDFEIRVTSLTTENRTPSFVLRAGDAGHGESDSITLPGDLFSDDKKQAAAVDVLFHVARNATIYPTTTIDDSGENNADTCLLYTSPSPRDS